MRENRLVTCSESNYSADFCFARFEGQMKREANVISCAVDSHARLLCSGTLLLPLVSRFPLPSLRSVLPFQFVLQRERNAGNRFPSLSNTLALLSFRRQAREEGVRETEGEGERYGSENGKEISCAVAFTCCSGSADESRKEDSRRGNESSSEAGETREQETEERESDGSPDDMPSGGACVFLSSLNQCDCLLGSDALVFLC